jgi:hypothetical protein
MAKRIPTQLGDVLILQTTQSYTIYAVGRVSKTASRILAVKRRQVRDRTSGAAVARAKALVVHGRRVFFGTSTQTIGLRSEDRV